MSEARELADKLITEGEKLAGFFEGLPAAQWSTPVYSEGASWTVRNVLAHVMTAERAFARLFEDIRQGGPGVAQDFAIDRYNARQQEKTQALGPGELLGQFRAARAEMAAWVAGLEDGDLERRGRHPFLGVTTLREMIRMVYIHNQTHYRDIRRALKG